MQELNQQEFDMKVFSNISKVPFGENVKEYFVNDFSAHPSEWDSVFQKGLWMELDEEAREERKKAIDAALAKFDVKRAIFDL